MRKVYLKSTGQEVQLFDAALPPALVKRGESKVKIIIPPARPGESPRVEAVRRDKLRFVKRRIGHA